MRREFQRRGCPQDPVPQGGHLPEAPAGPSSSTEPEWGCYRPALSFLTLHPIPSPFPWPSLVHLLQTIDSPTPTSSPALFPEPPMEQCAASMRIAPGRPAPYNGPVTLPKMEMFTRAPDSQSKDSLSHLRREMCTQVLLCGSLCPHNTGTALPCFLFPRMLLPWPGTFFSHLPLPDHVSPLVIVCISYFHCLLFPTKTMDW